MKTTYFLFSLAFPLMVLAQAPESKKALTKEQRLELHTKKMQLALASRLNHLRLTPLGRQLCPVHRELS